MNQVRAKVEDQSLQRRYELRDAPALAIAVSGLGILLLTLAAMLVAWLLYRASSGESPMQAKNTGAWSNDQGDVPLIMEEQARMRQQIELRLTQYGWVDEDRGIARIPIEEAMRIVSEEGLPQWGDPQQRTLIEEIYRNASDR